MDAKLTNLGRMQFVGVADSGHEVSIDGRLEVGGDDSAVHPMELIALGLGGCTAMDVLSILRKKRQAVEAFEVRLHLDRAEEYPKVFTRAVITYEVRGSALEEAAVRRAIELSALKYCPAQAMLSKAFPIEYRYILLDTTGALLKEGTWEPQLA
ncbi:MAG: OsmC family protein [Bacteroidota bacterium]